MKCEYKSTNSNQLVDCENPLEESTFGGDYDVCCKWYCFTCFLFVFSLTLAILQLVFVHHYGDSVKCSPFVTPQHWLSVQGQISIVVICILVLVCILFCISFDPCFLCVFLFVALCCIIITIFQFVWLVCGSVMFWQECSSHTGSRQIDLLMWVSLSCGYIFAIMQLVFIFFVLWKIIDKMKH